MKKDKKKNVKKIEPETIDVVLSKGHYHKGDLCVAGETITVTLKQAGKLEENRIGFRVKVSESGVNSQD